MNKSNYTKLRIFGYAVTLLVHLSNTLYMFYYVEKEKPSNPEIQAFTDLQYRYFTCWNLFFHISFSVVGLITDIKLLLNSDNPSYNPSQNIEELKGTYFSALVWPSTWVSFGIYWPLYLYDRDLICPPFVDTAISPISTHIMHTGVLCSLLWEVCFRFREKPLSHKRNVLYFALFLIFYGCILAYTYIERGIWVYPFLDMIYGTIYFPLLFLSISFFGIGSYYLQWLLVELVWGTSQKSIKIR